MNSPIFQDAQWIWDRSDRNAYHSYLRARQVFTLKSADEANLLITADALYQVWVNGACVGHGPAKSAAGRRSVDEYDLRDFVRKGENEIEILVLAIGVGTMTYCAAEAGLIFEIQAGSQLVSSGTKTQVRREASRAKPTVRRWILPCVEDVDLGARSTPWKPAVIVESDAELYRRRVPLPTREALYPKRLVGREWVELPNFQVGYRVKPVLVSKEEVLQHEIYDTEAEFRLVITSPIRQKLTFTPTLGSAEWSFKGKVLFTGSGWSLPTSALPEIQLEKGANELGGRHVRNHFEHICLAGFVKEPVQVSDLEVTLPGGQKHKVKAQPFSNPYDLAIGARPSSEEGTVRTIWDLGAVHNGWISFEADGDPGATVMLSFFEAMDGDRIQWPDGCNNALSVNLAEGRLKFESFFPYGVRYIAVHTQGDTTVSNLRVLNATCCGVRQGSLVASDLLHSAIYRIATQCLESGTDDTYTDCPTFEQVNWNFDNRYTSQADFLTGPNPEIARNSILLFAEDPACHGLVNSQTPSAWMTQPIPLWSFAWLEWCWDYYWSTGDEKFVHDIFPAVARGIDDAIGRIGSRGLMEWPGVWHFSEWGHGRDDSHAINSAEQAGLVSAMNAAEKLAKVAKADWSCSSARKSLIKAVNKHLWDAKRHSYADSLHEDGKLSPVSSQLTNAMMANSGIASKEWSAKLAKDIVGGKSRLLPYGSPYGLLPILELLNQEGETDSLFEIIAHRWGDMVIAGDGTTWEHFAEYGHGSWPTRSRCHPFSTYIIKYYVRNFLGIEALSPGFAKVRVDPRPPKSLKFCQGAIPVPDGIVNVQWKRKDGKIDIIVDAPAGISVVK